MDISTGITIALVLLIGLGSVLHLVHPSRQGARTHLVHVVEAARSLRYRFRHWWDPTDSSWRRRCERGSLLGVHPARAACVRRNT